MYWYPNQFPELKEKDSKHRISILYSFHKKYGRISLFYMLGFMFALAIKFMIIINSPDDEFYVALSWLAGFIVWCFGYLTILNKIEYPLLKEFMK